MELQHLIFYQQQIMGQKLTSEHCQIQNNDLINRLVYVMTEQSKYFGQISVHRLNQKPYDYFLMYRQMAIESQVTKENIEHKKKIYKALENTRCLVRVEATTMKQSMQLCTNSIQFNSYCRYHNYTLENAIQCKKSHGKNFKEADLFYIMGSLIGVGSKLNTISQKGYIGIFKSYKIYLSTEGYIKVYPFQLLTIGKIKPSESNLQTNTNRSSSVRQLQLDITPKQPQELSTIRPEKDDIKDLANLMIELIFLQKRQEFNFQLQIMLAKKRLSQRFKQLLLNIIANKKTYTFQMLNEQILQIKQEQNSRASYSIRLQEDISLTNSTIIKQKEDEILQNKTSQLKRLASFQKNLVASKINLLYKRSGESIDNI